MQAVPPIGAPAKAAPVRLRRWEWLLLLFLFALAAGLRLQLVDADYYSDEPMSYALSSNGLKPPANVFEYDGAPSYHYYSSWYWERPGFYLGMTPGAWFSFQGYRIEYILVASLLAPLAARLLRAFDVRPAIAYAAGAVVALHPQFLVWGTITHMDTPMTVALAGAFLASKCERYRLAGLLFVLAVWIKETAMPFLVLVFIADLGLQAWRTRRLPWPLALDGRQSALLVGILFGFIPFVWAQEMWFGLPGEKATGQTEHILDGVFLALWLVPLVMAGLAWPRTRELSVWGLALPAFYVGLHLVVGWSVREWYMVGSAFFAMLAAAGALDGWIRRSAQAGRLVRARPLAVAVVVLVMFATVLVQPDHDSKRAWANPLSNAASFSVEQTLEREKVRDPNARAMLAAIRDAQAERVLLVDLHYAFLNHPIPTYVQEERFLFTGELQGRAEAIKTFVDVGERYANLTVVGKQGSPTNQAIRHVYADCVTQEGATYVFVDMRACAGRFERLYEAIAFGVEAAP